ncbi:MULTISPECIES: hypothetical protein [Actinomyces]|uniref:Uncharacterized protein n=2 Tax=Actinomyces TaxID=1654 RepID=A0A1M4RZ07_9ACTO|nr:MULTISPECIES: hypothetical protein [Actinomyces]CED92173.1 Hypothetical protein AAM4_2341 [Actinomyces succiniciruminis]SHE25206.1 Hypothetical protein ACGLYG10_1422 [Actinomyces glycerinitolerans]
MDFPLTMVVAIRASHTQGAAVIKWEVRATSTPAYVWVKRESDTAAFVRRIFHSQLSLFTYNDTSMLTERKIAHALEQELHVPAHTVFIR